jgi:hypothetical protein
LGEVLDEIISALDPELVSEVLWLIVPARSPLPRGPDAVAFMSDGAIVESGPLNPIREH